MKQKHLPTYIYENNSHFSFVILISIHFFKDMKLFIKKYSGVDINHYLTK